VTQAQSRQYAALERLAHEHDQIELEKAALGREWRKLSLALHGDADEGYAVNLLGFYDPRLRAVAGSAAPGASAAGALEPAAGGNGGGELPERLRAFLEGSGTGPGGRRTRGDRRRSARLRRRGAAARPRRAPPRAPAGFNAEERAARGGPPSGRPPSRRAPAAERDRARGRGCLPRDARALRRERGSRARSAMSRWRHGWESR